MKKLLDNVLTYVIIAVILGVAATVIWFITTEILVVLYVYLIGYPSYFIFGSFGWNLFACLWNYFLLYFIQSASFVYIALDMCKDEVGSVMNIIKYKVSGITSYISKLFTSKKVSHA